MVANPTEGYGIFIENMLGAAQMPQARAAYSGKPVKYMKKLSLFEHTPGVSYNRDNCFVRNYSILNDKVLSLLYHTTLPWTMPSTDKDFMFQFPHLVSSLRSLKHILTILTF